MEREKNLLMSRHSHREVEEEAGNKGACSLGKGRGVSQENWIF
jgi:hypothetical protein